MYLTFESHENLTKTSSPHVAKYITSKFSTIFNEEMKPSTAGLQIVSCIIAIQLDANETAKRRATVSNEQDLEAHHRDWFNQSFR